MIIKLNWHFWCQNTTELKVYKFYVSIYCTRIYLVQTNYHKCKSYTYMPHIGRWTPVVDVYYVQRTTVLCYREHMFRTGIRFKCLPTILLYLIFSLKIHYIKYWIEEFIVLFIVSISGFMAGCCTGVFFGVGNSVGDTEQKF